MARRVRGRRHRRPAPDLTEVPVGPTGDHAILQVHPSRRCNLQCLHCYSDSGPSVRGALDVDVLARVVEEAAALGYGVLGVSGGEPLMYPGLVPLLRAAKDAGMRTTVTTNGLLLTERRIASLVGLVDVLAISVDGAPGTHDRIRDRPGAFERVVQRIPGVAASGIPFGFISTLTMSNLDELELVVLLAAESGASLVQVHPLEAAGAAIEHLSASLPDDREMAFGLVEAARLSLLHEIPVQVDVASRGDLVDHPARFFADESTVTAEAPPSPLVVEADGWIVPLTYGFPRAFAVGDLGEGSPLRELLDRWDPAPFLAVCRRARARLLAGDASFFSWYDEVQREAQRSAPAALGPARGRAGGA